MPATLVLEYSGWCLMRIPTDPDPTDEPRGASGYTFAFAGEPDLDRLIYLQPPDPKAVPPRTFGPKVGVSVSAARRVELTGETRDLPALIGAKVDLLGRPMLENRNWTLTLPGQEPIVPFKLEIKNDALRLYRDAPLDPAHPDMPVWRVAKALILAQGAAGISYEPGTVGKATGIWNALGFVTKRRDEVKAELARLEKAGGPAIQITNLKGRLYELEFAVANPGDRRVLAKNFVERFGFSMVGKNAVVEGGATALGGTVDKSTAWSVTFWIGAWDPDALCAFMEGTLSTSYVS